MDDKQLAKRQRILAKIQEFTLMDDDFMTRFFADDKERTEFLLRTILERDDLVVTEVTAQKVIDNLKGRSVRLDVFARDSEKKPYDIEIQRADEGAGARRARYNASLMDADETVPMMKTEELPETFVIFITENDVFNGGLPLYHINRKIEELNNKDFNDGLHIIYVNGKYRGNDPIGDLMHDFSCKKSADMKNAILAEKVRQLKEDEEGTANMCKIMEDFSREERAEERSMRDIETAAKLLEHKKMSEEEIADFFGFSAEQMKLVKEQVATYR